MALTEYESRLAAAAEAQAKAAADGAAASAKLAAAAEAQAKAAAAQALLAEQQAKLNAENSIRFERQVAAMEAAAPHLDAPEVGGGPAPLTPNQRAAQLRQAVLLALITSGAYMRPNTASTPEGHAAEAARDAARLELNVAAVMAASGPQILAQ